MAYPPDYVDKLIIAIESYKRKVVMGVHGALIQEPITDYYSSRRISHYKTAMAVPQPVHVLGTGTVAYHTSTIQVAYSDFKVANMADIWFAKLGVILFVHSKPLLIKE